MVRRNWVSVQSARGLYRRSNISRPVFVSECVLQPKLNLTHRDLQSSNCAESSGKRRGRANTGRWSSEGRVGYEIEGRETKRQTMALQNPEALVGGEIPILLGGTADYVTARIAHHALWRNRDS